MNDNNKPQSDFDRFIDLVVRGDTAAMQVFPDIGLHINAQDEEGWTPLLWAAATGQTAAAHILLGRGALVNTQGKKGETALMCAAETCDAGMLMLLARAGAKADIQNHAGETVRDILQQMGRDDLLSKLSLHVAETATRAEQPIAVRKPLVLKKPGL